MPTLVSYSCLSMYLQTCNFLVFRPLLYSCFWCVFCWMDLCARVAAAYMGALPLLTQVPNGLEQHPLCHKTLHKSSTAPYSKQFLLSPFLAYFSCHFVPLHSTMRCSLWEFYSRLLFINRTLGISPDLPHGQWSTYRPILSFLLVEKICAQILD